MKIECFLEEEDFLTYQLFTAAKSERIKKKRRNSWIITTSLFLSLSLLFYVTSYEFLPTYFLVAGMVSLFLYPLYSRWRYKNHYQKFIRENRQGVIGKEVEMEFTPNAIIEKSELGESKINTSELGEINEISSHYFLKMTTGNSIIINKERLLQAEEIQTYLEGLSEKLDINFNRELDWKWT